MKRRALRALNFVADLALVVVLGQLIYTLLRHLL